MLVFLIPLRHPDTSDDVPRLLTNLQRTVRSACNQRSPEFHVIVIGTGIQLALPERVELLDVAFAPVVPTRMPTVPQLLLYRDKAARLLAGMLYAARYAPEYVMFLDADDLVSNRLAGFVAERPGRWGWVFERSWIYRDGTQHLKLFGNFNQLCGSCMILRYEDLPRPDLPWNTPAPELVAAMREVELIEIYGDHCTHERRGKLLDRPLEVLPFPGAVYIQAHGMNNLKNRGPWGNVPLDAALCEEFGLERPPPHPLRALDERLRHGWGKLRGFSRELREFLRGW